MLDKELKTVTLDDVEYQIVEMTPFDASWVHTRVVAKAIPLVRELLDQGGDIEAVNYMEMVPVLIGRLSQEELQNIQETCLAVCRKCDKGAWMPIYDKKNHRFLYSDISAPTLFNLTIASAVANLSPFFSAKALKGLFQSFTGSLLLNQTT